MKQNLFTITGLFFVVFLLTNWQWSTETRGLEAIPVIFRQLLSHNLRQKSVDRRQLFSKEKRHIFWGTRYVLNSSGKNESNWKVQ